jgi:hypothetical protein
MGPKAPHSTVVPSANSIRRIGECQRIRT